MKKIVKVIMMVIHIVFWSLTILGLYGKKFTSCKPIGYNENAKDWTRYNMSRDGFSLLNTDQGKLICCHGCMDGKLHATKFQNMTLEHFAWSYQLEGRWMVNSCYTGEDYTDDQCSIIRVNRKPYVSLSEWSYDGTTLYTYSNWIMDRLHLLEALIEN